MEKIPTAKAFYQNYIEENNHDSHVDIEEMLIEFAKIHVEAALKEASEKAKTSEFWEGNTGSEYCETIVDKESILNSYPLNNIK
jgi:hypothetical protein